jgi:hypothetical protein
MLCPPTVGVPYLRLSLFATLAPRVDLATHAIVGVVYLGLVLLVWLPLGYKNGMSYETAFPYNSETSSFWHGFFYSDPLRVYTNVFYNLGYHLSASGTGPPAGA